MPNSLPDASPGRLTLSISPCPNDTFMFDALLNGKIDTEGLHFETRLEDVETLNKNVLAGKVDISKVSFAAYAAAAGQYQILDAGSALGQGVGPLLVCRPEHISRLLKSPSFSVVVPGFHTTADFLFSMFYPAATQKKELVFSEIEKAVLDGHADAGVLIHEGRFTYESKGLAKIADLGALWEADTGLPIPLGGIAVRRSLPEPTKKKINRLLRRSIELAFEEPAMTWLYVKRHAQEMDDDVIRQHIALYVNEYSLSLGKNGRVAVEAFLRKAYERGLLSSMPNDVFVNEALTTEENFRSQESTRL